MSRRRPSRRAGKIACYTAEAVFRQRTGKKDAPIKLLGYTSLEGPIPCPTEDQHPQAIAASPWRSCWHRRRAAPGTRRTKMDPEAPKSKAHFKYTTATTFAWRSCTPTIRSSCRRTCGCASRRSGRRTRPRCSCCIPPTKPKFEDPAIAAVYKRFYQRRNMVKRRVPFTGGNDPIQRLPVDEAIMSCFEKMAAEDWCGAQAAGETAVARDPNVSEGWFCLAYNHLNHDAKGTCYGK